MNEQHNPNAPTLTPEVQEAVVTHAALRAGVRALQREGNELEVGLTAELARDGRPWGDASDEACRDPRVKGLQGHAMRLWHMAEGLTPHLIRANLERLGVEDLLDFDAAFVAQAAEELRAAVREHGLSDEAFFGPFSRVTEKFFGRERGSRFGHYAAKVALWPVATREIGTPHKGYPFAM